LLQYEGDKEDLNSVWLGYTETTGSPALREEISKLCTKVGPHNLLVHAGAQEVIHNFSKSILGTGDHAIVVWPCYQSLDECPRSTGCSVSHWNFHEREDGSWFLNLEELEKEIIQHPNTKVVFINSPHNPTGYTHDVNFLQKLVNLCKKFNLILFSDEVYSKLEPEALGSIPAVCDLYEQGVSLNVMSKSFGLPGLRIGWAASQNQAILKKMAAYKDYVSICSAAPSEYLATVALKHKEKILKRNKQIIKSNLEILDAFFDRHQDLFVWKSPPSGCVAFVKLLKGSAEKFCVDLVEKKGVLLLPSTMYSYGDSHFRLGFGRSNMPTALKILEEFIQEMKTH